MGKRGKQREKRDGSSGKKRGKQREKEEKKREAEVKRGKQR